MIFQNPPCSDICQGNLENNPATLENVLEEPLPEIISLDFFVVPTITFKLLHVLVFLSHDRRKVVHFNVTAHPTSEWATQQLRNAFCDEEPPKFLIRDRDSKFGEGFTRSVSALGIRPILTAYRSPWQNGYVERLIGSIRRECLDHLIIINETHLRGILQITSATTILNGLTWG